MEKRNVGTKGKVTSKTELALRILLLNSPRDASPSTID